jgi:DNA-binding NtrC family response regulator
LSEEALATLRAHDWPGNVRELMTVIERAVLVSQGVVGAEQIGRAMLPVGTPARAVSAPTPDQAPKSERERIIAALDECGGNQSRAAKVLGISRRTLINRIEEYGVPRPRK